LTDLGLVVQLFFDNERRNAIDVSKLGVVCIHTPDGEVHLSAPCHKIGWLDTGPWSTVASLNIHPRQSNFGWEQILKIP
jgi:hypothetical protein